MCVRISNGTERNIITIIFAKKGQKREQCVKFTRSFQWQKWCIKCKLITYRNGKRKCRTLENSFPIVVNFGYAIFCLFCWISIFHFFGVSLRRQFENSPFACFTGAFNVCEWYAAWKCSIFFYVRLRMRWEKRWIKSYPIWIVQNKSVNAIQLVFSAFFVLSSFRLPPFHVSISISFTRPYMGNGEFSVLLSRNLNFIVFFFVYRQIHFDFFFCFGKSRIIGLLVRSPQICQHKKKTFNSNTNVIRAQQNFHRFRFVLPFVFYAPDSWTNSNERLRTNFSANRLSKRFFFLRAFQLPFGI